MDKKTENILNNDSISNTEKAFGGKHWSEFSEGETAVSMFNFMSDSKRKKEHLKSLNDTYFGMTWAYFKDLIKSKGFINGYSYNVLYSDYGSSSNEEMIIYYHPTKGLVIWAESYSGMTSVNGGTLYGEIQANNEESETIVRQWLSSGGCRDREKLIYETSHDVREGLFSKLDMLESAGTFLNRWTNKDKFLWFVDYIENKEPGYNYKQITNDKISKCPQALQDIMGK